jgi:heme exporter protein B
VTRSVAIVLTILAKDLRVEARTKDILAVMGLFALLTVVLFHFAFDIGLEPEVVAGISAGMLWLSFAFSGVLGLARSFTAERDRETLRGLLVSPIDRALLYVAKLVTNVLFLGTVQLVTYPIFGMMLSLPWVETFPEILLVFTLGNVGFSATGTLFAAAGANARLREAMLPVLLFPIVMPALIASEEATAALLGGDGLASVGIWMKILATFDVVFLVAGVLLFEFAMEE